MKKILTLSKLDHSGAVFSWVSPPLESLELRMDMRDFIRLERPGYLCISVEVVDAEADMAQRRADQAQVGAR